MTNKIYHKSVKQAYDVIGGNTDLNPVLLQDGVFCVGVHKEIGGLRRVYAQRVREEEFSPLDFGQQPTQKGWKLCIRKYLQI